MQVPHEQEINIQNMNVELVAQMFKNYRSNVLFHLEGKRQMMCIGTGRGLTRDLYSNGHPPGSLVGNRLMSQIVFSFRQCHLHGVSHY